MTYKCSKCNGTFKITFKQMLKGISVGFFEMDMDCPLCGKKSICKKVKNTKEDKKL